MPLIPAWRRRERHRVASRPLTDGEIRLARQVFGDSIDYARVRVHCRRYHPFAGRNFVTPRGEIWAPPADYLPDYSSRDLGAGLHALFVHEMAHVWQYQVQRMALIARAVWIFLTRLGRYHAAYAYDLRADRDLLDYGMEQQASILEDWYLLGRGHAPRRMRNRVGADEARALYERVLARFLRETGATPRA